MTKIMIKNIWKAALLCIAFVSCDNDVDKLLCYDDHAQIENDITLAGALGDGMTDCSVFRNIHMLKYTTQLILSPLGFLSDSIELESLNTSLATSLTMQTFGRTS